MLILRLSAARTGPADVHWMTSRPFVREGNVMATYVTLYKYTEQGIRNIKDAPKRVEAAKKAAAEAGITVKETLWLQGEYDLLAIAEAPDEIVAAALSLNTLKMGNVHSVTMRAFKRDRETQQFRLGAPAPSSARAMTSDRPRFGAVGLSPQFWGHPKSARRFRRIASVGAAQHDRLLWCGFRVVRSPLGATPRRRIVLHPPSCQSRKRCESI
jgi:uncharacterized protein with GYD domain